jgi:hypothetical protein
MNKIQHDQRGSSHIVLIIGIIVLAVIGFAGYRVLHKSADPATVHKTAGAGKTTENAPVWPTDKAISWWTTGEGSWMPLPYDVTPPACPDPLQFELPVKNANEITSILYPGQTRVGVFEGKGGNYKAHGGLRFDKRTDNNVAVFMPFDGSVIRGVRFLVDGEIQYGFDIVNSCGVMIRLGHLRELTPAFQAIADTFTPAVEGDSRNTKIEPAVAFKTGDKIATAVGFKNTKNVGFDWGVYDLRKNNEASKDAAYRAAHADTAESAFHGLCWLELLNSKDTAIIKSLPGGDQVSAKKSDYCK